jgi:hypothetical protein
MFTLFAGQHKLDIAPEIRHFNTTCNYGDNFRPDTLV